MPAPTATIFVPYHALDELHLRGPRSAQPAASAVVAGTLYAVTDAGNALERSDGTSWAAYAPTPAAASNIVEYDFSTTTTAPPASGSVRFNAAHPYTGVTTVWLSVLTRSGTDVRAGLASQPAGATLYVQERADATHYAKFTTTGVGVDQGSYFAFPVTWVANGAAIGNNIDCAVQFTGGSAAVAAHAATHETGGSDAIATLTAAPLTLSGGQLRFPTTPNPSADAYTFDAYREDDWTPLWLGSSGQSGQTYSVQDGAYIKCGRFVHCCGRLVITARGTFSGTLRLGGLPFPSVNRYNAGVVSFVAGGGWLVAGSSFFGHVQTLATHADIAYYPAAGAGTPSPVNAADVGHDLFFVVSYHAQN